MDNKLYDRNSLQVLQQTIAFQHLSHLGKLFREFPHAVQHGFDLLSVTRHLIAVCLLCPFQERPPVPKHKTPYESHHSHKSPQHGDPQVIDALVEPVDAPVEFIGKVVDAIVELIGKVIDALVELIGKVIDALVEFIGKVIDAIISSVDGFKDHPIRGIQHHIARRERPRTILLSMGCSR